MVDSRFPICALLADPAQRRRLIVSVIVATQAREGIDTTPEEAGAAYDRVLAERNVSERTMKP